MAKSEAEHAPAGRPLVGILGGTFDPIHYGHLRMAEELADILSLDTVRFIPAATPPHRQQPGTIAAHRAAMVGLAVAGNPRFIMDERELHRDGVSYTIDTIISLREELGKETAICLIMGSDAFVRLDTWHRWSELLDYCHLVLVQRPNMASLQENLPVALQAVLQDHATPDPSTLRSSSAGRISVQQIAALDISATAIREDLLNRHSPRYLLPDSVIDYIHCHRLYR
ncbi:nicotinate-nucleotide adenylyltransferase [Methylophilaceae bacterium]|nr:nicotinate-nucleotide adenylyltransferase [Methylophilaceae bacterium]